MHEASWPRVKWLRLSWSRKDFLTACGSVLVGPISLVSSRLVSSCVVFLRPLRGRLGAAFGPREGLSGSSLGPPGVPRAASGALGPLLGHCWPLWVRAWAAPGDLLALRWRLLGRSWADLGPLLGPPGPLLGPPRALLGPLWPLLAAQTLFSRKPQKTW